MANSKLLLSQFISTSKFVSICYILFVFFPRQSSCHAVSALYIFGDSTVDAGNNNHLPNTTKGNKPPFGIDFDNKTISGRFTNGKTIADFLAMKLGLPLIPAYLDLSEDQRKHTKTGVNYGCGGSSILPHSTYRSNPFNLDMQIHLFAKTISHDLSHSFQTPQEVDSHVSTSLFFISMGSNDYTQNYFDMGNPNRNHTEGKEFADYVLDQFSLRLKRLVDLGAKRFLINNLIPLGCAPFFTRNTGICVNPLNIFAKYYADGLPRMLQKLQENDHSGCTFSYPDNFSFFQGEQTKGGVIDTKHRCAINSTSVCPDRDKYFFFDGFHTSQVANSEFVDGCFHKSLCTPNIKQLIQG